MWQQVVPFVPGAGSANSLEFEICIHIVTTEADSHQPDPSGTNTQSYLHVVIRANADPPQSTGRSAVTRTSAACCTQTGAAIVINNECSLLEAALDLHLSVRCESWPSQLWCVPLQCGSLSRRCSLQLSSYTDPSNPAPQFRAAVVAGVSS